MALVNFGQFHYSRIEFFTTARLFSVSISLMRGKYEGFRENKKNIFRTLDLQLRLLPN